MTCQLFTSLYLYILVAFFMPLLNACLSMKIYDKLKLTYLMEEKILVLVILQDHVL